MRATRCKSLLSTFPTRNNVRFLLAEPKIQKSARAQAVQGCAARVRIFGTSHNHESHGCSRIEASTMKQVSDGTGGNNFGRAGSVLSWRWDHSWDTLSNSGENKGLCHVIPGAKFRVEQSGTQTQLICGFRQETRSTEHVKHLLSSRLCQQYLGTLDECFQLVSARARESGSRPPDDCFCRTILCKIITVTNKK